MTLVQTGRTSTRQAEPVAGVLSLMVHVETTPETFRRLDVAVDLARRLDADLLGVGVEAFPWRQSSERLFPGEALLELQKALDDDLRRAREIFSARSAGLRTEWRAVETLPGPEIARLSRAADLIVAGGAPLTHGCSYRSADAADLVMWSGRPVLIAPPAGGRLRGEAVVVAWNDTREARRAIADSLPLLKLADEVLVVAVCDEDTAGYASIGTTEVVRQLHRHGVAARAKVVATHPDGTAEALRHQARVVDADLIVAGAYGHSRLGEWVFGGATRDLLNRPEHFVLLSH